LAAQGNEDIKHDADAGEMLAREVVARLVGIDDGGGAGQTGAGQMMIRDQYLHTHLAGQRHALAAGDAVVHGDD